MPACPPSSIFTTRMQSGSSEVRGRSFDDSLNFADIWTGNSSGPPGFNLQGGETLLMDTPPPASRPPTVPGHLPPPHDAARRRGPNSASPHEANGRGGRVRRRAGKRAGGDGRRSGFQGGGQGSPSAWGRTRRGGARTRCERPGGNKPEVSVTFPRSQGRPMCCLPLRTTFL